MQRPRQHIIETESKRGFNAIVPSHWVLREMSSDYGLDFMVEIFKNGHSTGNIFYVQLKGTDQNLINDHISYQLGQDHIDYYRKIISPVLLVIYSTQAEKFWGIWANQLKEVLVNKKAGQKSYKVDFTPKHLLREGFFQELEKTFSVDLPKKINISLRSNDEVGRLFHGQLLKWIYFYYGNYIETENAHLPDNILFDYKMENNSLIVAALNTQRKYDLGKINLSDDKFLYRPLFDPNNCPSQLAESLILVAFLFRKYNIQGSLEIVARAFMNYNGVYLDVTYVIELMRLAISNNLVYEIQKLVHLTVQSQRPELFQLFNMAFLINGEGIRLAKVYQECLLLGIGGFYDETIRGTLCYNLANSYRNNHELYPASHYYQIARKLKPDYLRQAFWWFEYAGVMFLAKHYRISEMFYKKSLDLNAELFSPMIFATIGDSLFFQGRFEEAKIEYEKYLVEDSMLFLEEEILKRILCEYLIESNLNNIKLDKEKSFLLIRRFEDERQLDLLNEAIACNPLNELAWFNRGVLLSEAGSNDDALGSFLIAACILDFDIEAWRNCLALSLSTNTLDYFYLVRNIVYRKFGPDGINEIADYLLNQTNVKTQNKAKLMELLQLALPEMEDQYSRVRMYST